MNDVQLIECPRDAMQGIKTFIPTEKKLRYLQAVLRCNFDTVDIGSFVSPRAIPQMQDTAAVLDALDLSKTKSKLLTIVANERGCRDAVQFDQVDYLGYPFSISENFQMRNTHKTIEESLVLLKNIIELTAQAGKELVVYLSMGFGNPYGDPWNADIVAQWTERLAGMGVKILSLSDTVGTSNRDSLSYIFSNLIPAFPNVTIGAHLHTTPATWHEKVDAAYQAGCRRFDGAIQGFGGCPMAADALTGNMPTEKVLSYLTEQDAQFQLDRHAFESTFNKATELFGQYH